MLGTNVWIILSYEWTSGYLMSGMNVWIAYVRNECLDNLC